MPSEATTPSFRPNTNQRTVSQLLVASLQALRDPMALLCSGAKVHFNQRKLAKNEMETHGRVLEVMEEAMSEGRCTSVKVTVLASMHSHSSHV